MIFTTPAFLIFLAAVLILLKCIRHRTAQHALLLCANLFFYAFYDVRFVALLIVEILLCYCAAMIMQRNNHCEKARKVACVIAVVLILSILFFFKYINFAMENLGLLFGASSLHTFSLILPLGISFYTFQAVSYMIDVYRRKLSAEPSLLKVAVYISFFPQISSGPIVRATEFLPQLEEDHPVKWSNIISGAQVFLFGFLKKKLLADTLAVFVNSVFSSPSACDSPTIALAMVSFTLQIYLDFSGYSDMAIGVARMMGYTLPRNFDMPLLSTNIAEFWRRWHISLSTWFRDYMYIPLGGNRKGEIRTCLNLMAVMTVCGLWHGADWVFVVWGFAQGGAMVINRIYRKLRKIDKNTYISPVKKMIAWIPTIIFVIFSFALFKSSSMADFLVLLKKLFSFSGSGIHHMYVYTFIGIAVMAVASIFAIRNNKGHGYYPLLDLKKLGSKVIFAVAIWVAILFSFTGSNPFVYFQF